MAEFTMLVNLDVGARVRFHPPMVGTATPAVEVARVAYVHGGGDWPGSPPVINLNNGHASVPHISQVPGAGGNFWTMSGFAALEGGS